MRFVLVSLLLAQGCAARPQASGAIGIEERVSAACADRDSCERPCRERRDGLACVRAAEIWTSNAGAWDGARAAELFALACDAEVATGCDRAALVARRDASVAQRYRSRARALYRRDCGRGEPDACKWLGLDAVSGDDFEAAKRWAVRAGWLYYARCTRGDARSCHEAAWVAGGKLGRALSERSCRRGHLVACCDLVQATTVRRGEPPPPEEIRDGCRRRAEALQAACERDPLDCRRAADLHRRGLAGPRDRERAAELERRAAAGYRAACEAANPIACSGLALMHRTRNDGVAKDPIEAEALDRRACELGYRSACDPQRGAWVWNRDASVARFAFSCPSLTPHSPSPFVKGPRPPPARTLAPRVVWRFSIPPRATHCTIAMTNGGTCTVRAGESCLIEGGTITKRVDSRARSGR